MRVRACLRRLLLVAVPGDPEHRMLQALSVQFNKLQPL
jgi:hypothetical protein